MIIFNIFYILLWIVYFYDEKYFLLEFKEFKNYITEKKFNQIICSNHKDPNTFMNFRIVIAIVFFVFYNFYYLENMSIFKFIIGVVILFVTYKLVYWNEIKKYQKKLDYANRQFPYYLNNLTMMIANNPVLNALYDSIDQAPEVFVDDLYILVKEIYSGTKCGIKPYLDFSSKYPTVDGLHKVMCTLYNMNSTAADSQIVLTSLCKLANEKVNSANKQKLESNLDKQALMPWIGFFWIGFVLISLFTTINIASIGEL